MWDSYVMVDWSGGNDRGKTPKADAIGACVHRNGIAEDPQYFRSRQAFTKWINPFIETELTAGRTAMIGFDFPFGYPEGFGKHLTGQDDPLAVWQWLLDRIEDAPKANNRFDIAGEINKTLPGTGPFWGNGLKRDIPHLPRKGLSRGSNPFPERRRVDMLAKGTFTCWQLAGAGAVGSQTMMGLPILQTLRQNFANKISIWPFEPLDSPIAFVEVWPTLFAGLTPINMIKDAHQVQATVKVLACKDLTSLHADLHVTAPVEGWILGIRQSKEWLWD